MVDFIFNSEQAQVVILCPTILNIFSLLIKLYSFTHILSVLPIAQLVDLELSVLVDFIFNSEQAQLVILCPTILNIFSLSIRLYSFTHILSVLPIAQLVERQTVVLKVVGSNPA